LGEDQTVDVFHRGLQGNKQDTQGRILKKSGRLVAKYEERTKKGDGC